jgi:phage tail-like protein
MSYFVFNKEQDFLRGYAYNLRYDTGGVRIAQEPMALGGAYYSWLLDSREKETSWHRIVADSESLGDASIRFTFYASEERLLRIGDETYDLEEFIRDPALSRQDKEDAFLPYKVKTLLNPTDALLHEAVGRYLWFCVELYGQGAESPVISGIKVYLPVMSWMGYLPEVYQADAGSKSFVERYLYIFQSLYEDMEREINRLAGRFDPDVVDGGFLLWLAQWIDIDDAYIWSEDQLRRLIRDGMRLYKSRGTRQALSEMVELYLGEKPCIVENFQLEGYEGDAKRSGLVAELYGADSYYFTVVVSERAVPSTKEHKTLLRVIESAKPAHVEANVVVLKPYIFLDKYSYLGINSVLGQYRPANLDGFSAVPFSGVID